MRPLFSGDKEFGSLTAEQIRDELERVLASRDFAKSKRLNKFLRYIVEESIAGRGDKLNEYTIGQDVFDRGDTFDPQTNSVVRVEASRLRAKLERYFETREHEAVLRISLPSGGYRPEFEPQRVDRRMEQGTPANLAVKKAPPIRAWLVALTAAALLSTAAAVTLTAFHASDILPWESSRQSSIDEVKPPKTNRLVVLPLRNVSDGLDEDYLSDGITQALIARLAQKTTYRVISATSAMAYKNDTRPLLEIANELDVDRVVEGSIMRVGDHVRITAKLIDADTDHHVWTQSYERKVSDVLNLQENVATQIANALSGQADLNSNSDVGRIPSIEPAAYEAYLKGRFFLNKMTEEGFKRGLTYFREAIRLAPGYSPAYSGLATCYCLLGGHGFETVNPHEAIPTARKAVMEALRLDDESAEAHAFLGIIRLKYDWDWTGAEESFRRSISLYPDYPQAHIFYSYYLEAMGQREAAIAEARYAREIDPLSLSANVNLGWQLLKAGQLDEGLRTFRDTAELAPDFWGVHWGLGQFHRMSGDYEAAIESLRKAVDAGGGHAMPLSALGYTYALSGRTAEAHEILTQLEDMSDNGYVSPFNMAIIHAGMGNADAAFSYLEQAFSQRSRAMAWLNVTEELGGLRGDARFDSLLKRVGLPQLASVEGE
jgi:TolB-like protein/Tfp pilus assembly protein PilF